MARKSPLLKTLKTLPNIEKINSLEDERIDRWRRIGLYHAARQEQGIFQVEGLRPVELLLAQKVYKTESLIIVSEEIFHRHSAMQERIAEILRQSSKAGVSIYDVPRALFRRIANVKKIRGVMAIARRGDWTMGELISEVARRRGLALAVVNVVDPGNLGTLMRSAHAFGGVAVFALEGSADPFHPKTIRGSAGHLLPALSGSWQELREACSKHDVDLIGLEVDDDQGVELENFDPKADRPIVIGLGSEGSGFPEHVYGFDQKVNISMSPDTDSLNVAVAGSLVMWKLGRRGAG